VREPSALKALEAYRRAREPEGIDVASNLVVRECVWLHRRASDIRVAEYAAQA